MVVIVGAILPRDCILGMVMALVKDYFVLR